MSAITLMNPTNSRVLNGIVAGTYPITTTTITASNNITSTAGNIVASAGNIVATAGVISAGTNLIATDNVVAQTGDISAAVGDITAGAAITAGTTITANAGNITATTGSINAPLGSISAGGVITATGGLTIGVGSTTTFLRFDKITTDWAGIPANSGVAGTAVALVEQQNYQFDSTGVLVWDTLEVLIGNCVPAGDGALIVACITLQEPENGANGYVNLSFSFINTTNIEVVPASCSFILYSV